jgi:hypothetical protein
MNGQMVYKGIATEVVTENIFYCEESNSVFLSTEKHSNHLYLVSQQQ